LSFMNHYSSHRRERSDGDAFKICRRSLLRQLLHCGQQCKKLQGEGEPPTGH
jgi:hypothetical protein